MSGKYFYFFLFHEYVLHYFVDNKHIIKISEF